MVLSGELSGGLLSSKKFSVIYAGIAAQPGTHNVPGIHTRMFLAFVTFFMTFLTLFHSLASRITKKLPQPSPEVDQSVPELALDAAPKEEGRPPSPTPPFTEVNLLSSVIKRLGELEEKVDVLQAKPSEMPYEKEELLYAAVCRVDALEAELIATKKVMLLITPLWVLYLTDIHLKYNSCISFFPHVLQTLSRLCMRL